MGRKTERWFTYAVLLLSVQAPPFAHGQANNPIVGYSCSGVGVVDCTNSATTVPLEVIQINLSISGLCQSGYTPSAQQYAFSDRCESVYNLFVFGYTENDQVLDDCGGVDIIGEVDAEASITVPNLGAISTTYSGQDCDGDAFESAPGAVINSPC